MLTENSYGYNPQITELPHTSEQFDSRKELIVQSGAVFIPAKVRLSDITPTVADQIAGVLEVWLRFAHEMNWYAGKGQLYAGGNTRVECMGIIGVAVFNGNCICY